MAERSADAALASLSLFSASFAPLRFIRRFCRPTCNLHPASCNPPPASLNPQLSTLNLLFLSLLLSLPFAGLSQTLSDETLAQIRFDQKPNSQVSLALPFRDEAGREVQLAQYFGKKPVLLVLGYYECPMLCTLVLNGMVASAADLKWSIGREFEVVNVSISPRETPALAAAKKRNYLKSYGRPGSAQGWHFLTGSDNSIRQLAHQVGFRYAYDPASKQYAHPSGLIILTPEGKVSRYLFGVTFPPRELYAALQEAASSKVGSPIQQLILLCFHYNPITGKYSAAIMVILRSMGVATMLGFLWLIVRLVRRGRAAQASLAAAASAPPPPAPPAALSGPAASPAQQTTGKPGALSHNQQLAAPSRTRHPDSGS